MIFVAKKDYPTSFAGPIASKIFSEFKKPTVVVSLQKDLARGAVRLPHYLDSLDALKSASKFLENYGGHKPASGFTAKKEKLAQVEEALRHYFQKAYKNGT
jgi:single-stranded-DNA-specific exonuclease